MVGVFINGPGGKIEARYHHSDKDTPPIALVLHPHPLYNGNMNNRVVNTLYECFVNAGFSVLKFNFRGVGRSQGQHDNGIGELIDAATALDWLQEHNPGSSSFWVAGFSFGALIASQLLTRRPEIQAFIAVSPPANNDFNFLNPCPARGLFVQGDMDTVVAEEKVAELVNKLLRQRNTHIEYSVIRGADHFFRDKIEDLSETVNMYIEDVIKIIGTSRNRPDKRRRLVATVG